MKRVRCSKCDHYIIFDETQYQAGQPINFVCPKCNKHFRIRMRASEQSSNQNISSEFHETDERNYGLIEVIENIFHYQQTIPLHLGMNIIGRFMKGNDINCPIMTTDPSIDMTHCSINVLFDKNDHLQYILQDGPSYTGTFVNNEILGNNEKRVIADGTLFTIGATSIILKEVEV